MLHSTNRKANGNIRSVIMKDAYGLYLKPWIKDRDAVAPSIAAAYDDNELWRHDMRGVIIAQVYPASLDSGNEEGWRCAYYMPEPKSNRGVGSMGPFPTAEIAMEKCDIRLLELGYILLTQERLAKIGLLI